MIITNEHDLGVPVLLPTPRLCRAKPVTWTPSYSLRGSWVWILTEGFHARHPFPSTPLCGRSYGLYSNLSHPDPPLLRRGGVITRFISSRPTCRDFIAGHPFPTTYHDSRTEPPYCGDPTPIFGQPKATTVMPKADKFPSPRGNRSTQNTPIPHMKNPVANLGALSFEGHLRGMGRGAEHSLHFPTGAIDRLDLTFI